MSFDGCDLTRLAPHRFCAAGIAIVPEGRRLFTGMTVRENLMLGSYAPTPRAARGASLERVCALFPCGPGKARGAGRRAVRRTAADGRDRPRASWRSRGLLLLDEPSLGLSPLIVQTMFAMIERIHGDGVAVLLVEQNVGARARPRLSRVRAGGGNDRSRATRRTRCASSRTSGVPILD
jgi:branched-chain amino acid transport system ATP-binding protein